MSSAQTASASPVAIERLYREAIVVDGLGPIFWYQDDFDSYVDKVLASGVTAFNHTCAIPYDFSPDSIDELARKLDTWEQAAERLSDRLTVARTVEDIERAKADGKVAVIFGIQNMGLVGNDASNVARLHALGVRIAGLTYQHANSVGGACGDEIDSGLTPLGREVVAALNEEGILICVSHVGERTSLEAIEASQKPVVFSHINVRNLANVPKNASDAQIDAIAGSGGVIGIAAWSPTVSETPNPHLDQFLAHISYIVDRVGIDHAAIGLDLSDGLPKERLELLKSKFSKISDAPWEYMYVEELSTVEKWPTVATGLASLGYGESDMVNVLGANFMRVFRQVWK
jgi:membrane dipeptidase